MDKEGMQFKNQALCGAKSLEYVLTQLGMEKEKDEKVMEWAAEMSLNDGLECNIVALTNKLTNKMNKHFPNQYSVKLYTDLDDTKMYKELVDLTLQKTDPSKMKKKADQLNQLNVIHEKCSLDHLKDGDIGIGVFVNALTLTLRQILNPLEYLFHYKNQGKLCQVNHYMMIKKGKNGIYVYDPHCHDYKPYQLSNSQVITDDRYLFSGIAIIVSKEGV